MITVRDSHIRIKGKSSSEDSITDCRGKIAAPVPDTCVKAFGPTGTREK